MPTVLELKELAKKKNIKGYYKMNKDELCKRLKIKDHNSKGKSPKRTYLFKMFKGEASDDTQGAVSDDTQGAASDDTLMCRSLDCVKFETENGFSVGVFPKGHYLFRSAEKHAFRERPTWYSDEAGAITYRDGDMPCKRYVSKRDIRLLNVSDIETIKKIYDDPRLTPKDRDEVAFVTNFKNPQPSKKFIRTPELSHVLQFFPLEFETPDGKNSRTFSNMRFARVICKLGYDGWIIPRCSAFDYNIWFTQEIMLCDSGKILEYTDSDCAKSLRSIPFSGAPCPSLDECDPTYKWRKEFEEEEKQKIARGEDDILTRLYKTRPPLGEFWSPK